MAYKIELEFDHIEDAEFFLEVFGAGCDNAPADSEKYAWELLDEIEEQIAEHKRNIISSQEQKID